MLNAIRNPVDHRTAQTWPVRAETEVASGVLRGERRDTWGCRALKQFWTWVQAAAVGQLFAVAIILIGIPVALFARGVIELVSWIAVTLR